MSVLCPHFQNLPSWASKVDYPGEWVKVMGPGKGIKKRFPNHKIVGRFYLKDEDWWIKQGLEGGRHYYRYLEPLYEGVRGEVEVIEGINEPGCETQEQCETLRDFLLGWIECMHTDGFRVAVPAFSVGKPSPMAVDALLDVWCITDYLSMHEYGVKAIDEPESPYHSLRHRLVAQRMECLNIPMPDLLITEAGIDRGGIGFRKKPGNTPWKEYKRQIQWYDQELQKDPYVKACFLFGSGCSHDWKTFDLGLGEWNDLVKDLA